MEYQLSYHFANLCYCLTSAAMCGLQAPEHAYAYPLTVLTTPVPTQVTIRTHLIPKPPAAKPNLPKTLQLRVLTCAGVPALYLNHPPAWTTAATSYYPSGHRALPSIGNLLRGLNRADASAAAAARLAGRGTGYWGAVRFSTVGFVAAAAVIGVSCFWYSRDSESDQQQGSSSSRGSSRPASGLDTAAVVRIVTSVRGTISNSSAADVAPSSGLAGSQLGQLSVYTPQRVQKRVWEPAFWQPATVATDTSSTASSSSNSSSDSSSSEVTQQHQKVKQQHLGVSLHYQGQLDKDLSLLHRAVGPERYSSSSSSYQGAYLAAWHDLMEQWESGEVHLAEALAERSLGGSSWLAGGAR